MCNLFLSFHFTIDDGFDRQLANRVQDLLASHNIAVVTGETLGGEPLTAAVLQRIEACDGLIALCTRREQAGEAWNTHPWVLGELQTARAKDKRAIAVVEPGVRLDGPYAENERVELDRGDVAAAIVRLSKTVGQWKRDIGRELRVQIIPDDQIADAFAAGEERLTCEYRFYRNGQPSDWMPANEPVPEPGGIYLYLEGVQDEVLIQLRIKADDLSGRSIATPQDIPIAIKSM
jgi:hypothetical protein